MHTKAIQTLSASREIFAMSDQQQEKRPSRRVSSREKLLSIAKRSSTSAVPTSVTTRSPKSPTAPLSPIPVGLNQSDNVAIRFKDSIIRKLRQELARSIPTSQFKKAVELCQAKLEAKESEVQDLKRQLEERQQDQQQQEQQGQQQLPQQEQQQPHPNENIIRSIRAQTNGGTASQESKESPEDEEDKNLAAEYPVTFQSKDLELKKLRHDLKQKDVLVVSLRKEIDTLQEHFHELQQQLQQEVQQHREATKRQLLQQKKDRDESQRSYAETSDFDDDDDALDLSNTDNLDGDPYSIIPVLPNVHKGKPSKMLSPKGSRRGGVARHSMFEMSESKLQTDGFLDASKSSATSGDWLDESRTSVASSDAQSSRNRGRKYNRGSSARSLRSGNSSPNRSVSPTPQKPRSWSRFDLSGGGTSSQDGKEKKKKSIFKSTGKAMKKTAQATGKAVTKGTKATGKALKKGTKATGMAVVKGGQAVKSTSIAVADATKNTGKVVLDTGVKTTKAVADVPIGIGKAVVGVTVATGTAVAGLGSNLLPRSLTAARGSFTQTKWDQAIDIISDIIEQEPTSKKEKSSTKKKSNNGDEEKTNDSTDGGTAITFTLTKDQKYDLQYAVKPLLIEGMQLHIASQQADSKDPLIHMPLNLIRNTLQLGTKAVGAGLKPVDNSVKFILSEFGGIAEKTFLNRPEGRLTRKTSSDFSRGSESTDDSLESEIMKNIYIPPEFENLSKEKRSALFKLLSWSSLKQWNFNIFELTKLCKGHPLVMMGWAILASPHSQYAMAMSCGIDDEIKIDELQGYHFLDHKELKIPHQTLCKYLRAIEDHYVTTNPYHNEVHAADILQTTHTMLQMIQQQKQYQHASNARPIFHVTTIEQFALLLTAVVHDVEHTGKNNAFEVNTQSEVALVYNDISVLENKHASRAFAIMAGHLEGNTAYVGGSNSNETNGPTLRQKVMLPRARRGSGNKFEGDEYNILCNTKPEQFHLIRTMVIDAVLHTDMSKHFQTVNQIKALMLSRTNTGTADLDHDSKWNVLMFLMHCADISGQAKPAPLFLNWTQRVIDEFFEQGDVEAKLGLPISPNCDRRAVKVPHSQVGFIEFVIKPAFEVLGSIVTSVEERVLPIIESNLQHWQSEQQKFEQKNVVGEIKRRSQLMESDDAPSAGQDTSEKGQE